jgi:hypothetical protein
VREERDWQIVRAPLEWTELFERAGFIVYEDELYVRGEDGWRSASLAEAAAARYRDHDAGAVLVAELRPKRASERLRLALRDARHRDEPRRSTLD